MSKKSFNWILRGLIGLASLGAMMTGWVAFSHAPKPGAAANTSSEGEFVPIPTLAPLPAAGSGSNVQLLPRQQAQILSQPRLRTRGS